MSSTTFNYPIPAAPAIPRGAVLVEIIIDLLSSAFKRLRPAPRTRTQEAAVVREMARQLQDSDPGLAADLLYAAVRHESLDDDPSAWRR